MDTVDVLRQAKAEIVDEARWGNTVLICDKTGRMCALGAIAKVLYGGLLSYGGERDEGFTYGAMQDHPAVAALGAVIPEPEYSTSLDSIWAFNDDHHHAQVIDLFDRAILALAGDTKPEPVREAVGVE